MRSNLFFYRALIFIGIFSLSCTSIPNNDDLLIKVLILSGKNNHEWQKTTPVLENMYKKTGLFITNVTERPDTLTYTDYKGYDVIVSNWNTWPDNELSWSNDQEVAFERYVNEGGGAVFIHAGASSFYGWDNYYKIGIGRWGDKTAHGNPTIGKVVNLNQDHPITKGIRDFYIMDEIWENTDIHTASQPLAGITATDEEDRHAIEESSVFVNQIGKGRSFYTILGHDDRALFNTGFQTLILRGTEWVTSGKVTMEVPFELREKQNLETESYSWQQTDTTIQLLKNSNLVWQYNFHNRFGKTYFHPLFLNSTRITCESPVDHPWHLGLWFTWKFINEVNYWEYMDNYKTSATGYRSEGVTELKDITFKKNPDYSADIHLDFIYHPIGKEQVLEESRNIHVSFPDSNGGYYIDYNHTFRALIEDVLLDRTPILGEPDGKSWGGYGGLSIRFNQDFTSPDFLPKLNTDKYPKGGWFYMGLNSLTGDRVGACMFQDPDYTTSSTRWYYANDPGIPFYWFGPAALYDKNLMLKKGEQLTLKYRVLLIPNGKETDLEAEYHNYIYRQ